jgi:hypothetical protein
VVQADIFHQPNRRREDILWCGYYKMKETFFLTCRQGVQPELRGAKHMTVQQAGLALGSDDGPVLACYIGLCRSRFASKISLQVFEIRGKSVFGTKNIREIGPCVKF